MPHAPSRPARTQWHNRISRIAIVALGLFGLIWLSGVRLYAFRGNSMIPAVMPDDHFVALVGLWKRTEPRRFDLVIFDVPESSAWAKQRIPWMKRLVGLPGEHVRLAGDALFINGNLIDAPFLRRDIQTAQHEPTEINLGEDQFFVLGDNLDHSLEDSRKFGPVHRSLLKGHVGMVLHGSKKHTEGSKSPL